MTQIDADMEIMLSNRVSGYFCNVTRVPPELFELYLRNNVFSDRLLPNARSNDNPIVANTSHDESDVPVPTPPAKTLITKPAPTTNESRIITFLK